MIAPAAVGFIGLLGGIACSVRDTTHGPRARPKVNAPVASSVKASPEPLSQHLTARGIQRRDVARGGSGTAEKRRPVVVEGGEVGRNLQWVGFDLCKPGRSKKRSQRWCSDRAENAGLRRGRAARGSKATASSQKDRRNSMPSA